MEIFNNKASVKSVFFNLASYIAGLVLILGALAIFQQAIDRQITVKDFQVPLLIGSNLDTRGIYSMDDFLELKKRYSERYSEPFDIEKSVPLALEIFYERWKSNPQAQFALFKEKIVNICRMNSQQTSDSKTSSSWCLWWATNSSKQSIYKERPYLRNDVNNLTRIFHALTIVLAASSLLLSGVLEQSRRQLILFIFASLGGILLLQGLHEYQARYALIYYFFFCLLSGSAGMLFTAGIYRRAKIGICRCGKLIFKKR